MSNISRLATLLLTCFFALNIQAQSVSTADQQGVEACYKTVQTALTQLDANAMGPLFMENAEVVSPMGEITRGRANLIAMYTGLFNYFRSLPKPDRHEQTNLFMQTRYLATDVILATYTEQTDNYFGEKKDTGKMTFSIVLRKTGGKWLIELVTLTPVISQPAANN